MYAKKWFTNTIPGTLIFDSFMNIPYPDLLQKISPVKVIKKQNPKSRKIIENIIKYYTIKT